MSNDENAKNTENAGSSPAKRTTFPQQIEGFALGTPIPYKIELIPPKGVLVSGNPAVLFAQSRPGPS